MSLEQAGLKQPDVVLSNPPVGSASSGEPRVPIRLFALKDGDTFAVADASGNILGESDGMFHDDTRVLSFFRLTLGGSRRRC